MEPCLQGQAPKADAWWQLPRSALPPPTFYLQDLVLSRSRQSVDIYRKKGTQGAKSTGG